MTEDEPRITSTPPLDLERLSEDELEARIVQLKAEINACQTELNRKKDHKNAAKALFGGG